MLRQLGESSTAATENKSMGTEAVLDTLNIIRDVHDFHDPALHAASGICSRHHYNAFLSNPTEAARANFTTRLNIHARLPSQQVL
jgi:hypothetical protein